MICQCYCDSMYAETSPFSTQITLASCPNLPSHGCLVHHRNRIQNQFLPCVSRQSLRDHLEMVGNSRVSQTAEIRRHYGESCTKPSVITAALPLVHRRRIPRQFRGNPPKPPNQRCVLFTVEQAEVFYRVFIPDCINLSENLSRNARGWQSLRWRPSLLLLGQLGRAGWLYRGSLQTALGDGGVGGGQ